jgi:hypothetical protein
MVEKVIKISLDSVTPIHWYDGVPVKITYYTAGYYDGTTNRHFGPVNHTHTLVIDGCVFNLGCDVLVRDGNSLSGKAPEVLGITESYIDDEIFAYYKVQDLPDEEKAAVMSRLKLLERHKRLSEIAIGTHDSNMTKLRLFNRHLNPNDV